MSPWKPDADAIAQVVDEIRSAGWLPSDRDWWPNFVYHSANVANAASILNHGELLSRNRARLLADGFEDCASPQIIARLSQEDRDWVRLYFRPLAPTQHANEGIRPKALYEFGAHMPVPVYLLFNAKNVLSLSGTLFTRGRLTPDAERGEDAAFLRSIDWRRVFHQGPFARKDRDAIINARHAEVLVKGSLSLAHLRVVVCRSAPERQTLLGLLEPKARRRWQGKIALERPGRELFYKRGTFVDLSSWIPTVPGSRSTPISILSSAAPFVSAPSGRGRAGKPTGQTRTSTSQPSRFRSGSDPSSDRAIEFAWNLTARSHSRATTGSRLDRKSCSN